MSEDPHSNPRDTRDLLRAQFDIAWSLAAYHLEGLTTAECLWRPARRGLHVIRDRHGVWRADWPQHEGYDIGPSSIAWTTWHICFWWRKALEHLRGVTTLAHEQVAWPGSAEAVRDEIGGLRAQWLAVLERADAEELSCSRDTSWPIPASSLAVTAAWLNVELTKNAAEIGFVRFLHAVRDAP